jgi:ubiquinone/menaquinone biosynthesis C-methylase UbiE
VRTVMAIDPNAGMKRLASQRLQEARSTIDYQIINGENLPMVDESFDTVVSTWTLCSIPQIDRAISEIYRVLKPNGKFFFIEHGLSDDPKVQVWQNRLTPIQKILGGGCHLNRPIRKLIEAKFKSVHIAEFYAPDLPKFVSYFYQGMAIK